MGTPRRPARGSWSLVAETRVRGFAPEAPRQRGQAAAPTPQSYLSVQGPFQPRPCLCICAPGAPQSHAGCVALHCWLANLACPFPLGLAPYPPPPHRRFSFSFLSGRCLPSPPTQAPLPPGPLEPVLWMLPHPTSLNFPCPKFPSVPGAPAWQYPGGGRPHLSGGLGPTGPAPGPSVHRHSSP